MNRNYDRSGCQFDLIHHVPVNNFSVMLGWVFLGCTSTKQGLMCEVCVRGILIFSQLYQAPEVKKLFTCSTQLSIRGSVVAYLTQDQRVAGLCLTGVIVLCPRARHINPCLVLVQCRKTCPDIAEKLLTRT